ncbi:hypothetical protein HID58_065853 [Brassica napus]|uniref:Uncharacterized protein n=1 Tax=Brassica napus TaxID=3708 RepID=A0ABQ7ZE18_BRANA|nr:hypothetical protein HID58_065853 [Brassica napus]
MTNGIDLAPGSSSIGIRVHSRCGVGNEARESMDLSDSSLDLTAEIEELRNAFTGEASPPPGGGIFSPVDTSRLDYSTGRDTIERLLELPLERREVSFLVSDEVLDQCSIRGLEVMSARKAAVKRTAPVEDEEVQLVGSSRRRATTAVSPSSSKKKSRASGFVRKTPSPASFEWSVVLSNLNAKVFPLVHAHLSLDGDSFVATHSLQGYLLQVAYRVLCLCFRVVFLYRLDYV